jgi:hypothetical protein
MFVNSEIHNSNKWIEEVISKNHIKRYEYRHFYNIEKIGNGNSGKVYRAKWKNSGKYLILKSFYNLNNVTVKEIICEVMCY